MSQTESMVTDLAADDIPLPTMKETGGASDDMPARLIVKQGSSLKTSENSKKKKGSLKVGFSIEEPPINVEQPHEIGMPHHNHVKR